MNTNNGRAAKLIPARAALGSGNNTLAEKRGVGESIWMMVPDIHGIKSSFTSFT